MGVMDGEEDRGRQDQLSEGRRVLIQQGVSKESRLLLRLPTLTFSSLNNTAQFHVASRILGGNLVSHKGENAQTGKGQERVDSHLVDRLILSTRHSTGLQSKEENIPISLKCSSH